MTPTPDSGPDTARELRRAVCGSVAPTPLTTGVRPQSVDLVLRGSGVRFNRSVQPAAGGWICTFVYDRLDPSMPPPVEGIDATGIAIHFAGEQRSTTDPIPAHGRSGAYTLSMVDPQWVATLQREIAMLADERGPALEQHCARLAAVSPPDPAAMESVVRARVAHFLETASPDAPGDAGGSAPDVGMYLATIALRCGFVDAGH